MGIYDYLPKEKYDPVKRLASDRYNRRKFATVKSGEFIGKTVTIMGQIPRYLNSHNVVFRARVHGFPLLGGWHGEITISEEQFDIIQDVKNEPSL